MTKESSSMVGKVFALITLLISLFIAIAGLYIVLTSSNVRSNDPMAFGLSAVVAILILLIIWMLWIVSKGLRRDRMKELQ